MPPRALGLRVILALDLLVTPLAAAPPSGEIPLIGVLRPVAADDFHTEAFRRGLRRLGHMEGDNVRMVYRFAEGRFERLPTLAHKWVRLPVDVLVTDGTGVLAPGKRPTRSRSSAPIHSPRGGGQP
jgi:putative ABC transport system substrate-binding protein